MRWLLFIYLFIYLLKFFFFFFLNRFYLFIYLLAALGLPWLCVGFSSCRGLLIEAASLVAEHRLQALRLQLLWHAGSVVVAHGL